MLQCLGFDFPVWKPFIQYFVSAVLVIAAQAAPKTKAGQPRLFCEYCEQLVKAGIVYCEGATSEDQVKQLLEKYCDQLTSGSFDFICKLIVDQGVVYIWDVIKNGGTPDKEAQVVCSCIGLCDGDCNLGKKD